MQLMFSVCGKLTKSRMFRCVFAAWIRDENNSAAILGLMTYASLFDTTQPKLTTEGHFCSCKLIAHHSL